MSDTHMARLIADDALWRAKLMEQVSAMQQIAVDHLASSALRASTPAALVNAWLKLLKFEYKVVKDAAIEPEDHGCQVGQLVQRAFFLAGELDRLGLGSLVGHFGLSSGAIPPGKRGSR